MSRPQNPDRGRQRPPRPPRAPRHPRGARAVAVEALLAVEEGARSADALRQHLPTLPDPRDRALATELVYGALRWRRRLDHALEKRVRQGLDRIEPVARELLRVGTYQVLFLDRIPAPIAVSATQDAARALGAGRLTGLLNGVLRRVVQEGERLPAGGSDAAIAVRWSLPEWVVAELRAAFGDEQVEEVAAGLRERPLVTVRPTRGKGGAEAVLRALAEEGFRATAGPGELVTLEGGAGDPFGTEAFCAGLYVPQDAASLAAVDALGAEPGERVLDLCAGRGIKSTALADRGVEVVAADIDGRKLRAARELAERLGVAERIRFVTADARRPPEDLGRFARVLIDAPCTGLGTLRRHPEIAWRRSPSDVATLSRLQAELLRAGADLLAPGGRLVYAVCSFTDAEARPVVPGGLAVAGELQRSIPESAHDLFSVQAFVRSQGDPIAAAHSGGSRLDAG